MSRLVEQILSTMVGQFYKTKSKCQSWRQKSLGKSTFCQHHIITTWVNSYRETHTKKETGTRLYTHSFTDRGCNHYFVRRAWNMTTFGKKFMFLPIGVIIIDRMWAKNWDYREITSRNEHTTHGKLNLCVQQHCPLLLLSLSRVVQVFPCDNNRHLKKVLLSSKKVKTLVHTQNVPSLLYFGPWLKIHEKAYMQIRTNEGKKEEREGPVL